MFICWERNLNCISINVFITVRNSFLRDVYTIWHFSLSNEKIIFINHVDIKLDIFTNQNIHALQEFYYYSIQLKRGTLAWDCKTEIHIRQSMSFDIDCSSAVWTSNVKKNIRFLSESIASCLTTFLSLEATSLQLILNIIYFCHWVFFGQHTVMSVYE